jgi:hypothetical protein
MMGQNRPAHDGLAGTTLDANRRFIGYAEDSVQASTSATAAAPLGEEHEVHDQVDHGSDGNVDR